MFMDVYYPNYTDPQGRPLRVNEADKVLPYMIQFETFYDMEQFMLKLRREFFTCASSNQSYRTLLVNMTFMRYAVIEKACKQSCVGDRTYTPEEFLNEVYEPWQRHEHKDLSPVIWEMDGDKYAVGIMSQVMDYKLDMEQSKVIESIRAANEAKQPIPPRSDITPLPAEYRFSKEILRIPYSASTTILAADTFQTDESILVEHRFSWEEKRCLEHMPYAKELIPFRPILIPLDKDGHPSRELFRSEPNGALTTGGSLYYHQGGKLNEWDGDGDPIRVKNYDTQKAFVGNTGTYPLEWMFWDGCLICLRPILKIKPRDIWESGLAKLDIDILPGAVLEDDPMPEPMEDTSIIIS